MHSGALSVTHQPDPRRGWSIVWKPTLLLLVVLDLLGLALYTRLFYLDSATIVKLRVLRDYGQQGSATIVSSDQIGKVINGYGVTGTLDDGVAEELARHRSELHLDRLDTLSIEAARVPARHHGELSLNGLTTINRPLAQALSRHEGDFRVFNGLTRPNVGQAAALTGLGGNRELDSLREVDDEVAIELSKHQGELHLNRLGTISDRAAEAIAKHRGALVRPSGD